MISGMQADTVVLLSAGLDSAVLAAHEAQDARTFADWGFDFLHHHELSHEWWGNLVTAADWTDIWIHEGFGAYMQQLYVEKLHGAKAYHQSMAVSRSKIRNSKPVAERRARSLAESYLVAPDYVESDGDNVLAVDKFDEGIGKSISIIFSNKP